MKKIIENSHYFYLLLALIGGGLTFYCTLHEITTSGSFNTIEFVTSTWTDSYYAKSITLDFWTGAIAGTFLILIEGMRLKMKNVWLYIVITIFIAFAVGFPLFLYFRHKHLNNIRA